MQDIRTKEQKRYKELDDILFNSLQTMDFQDRVKITMFIYEESRSMLGKSKELPSRYLRRDSQDFGFLIDWRESFDLIVESLHSIGSVKECLPILELAMKRYKLI